MAAYIINEKLYEYITQAALEGFEKGAHPLNIAANIWAEANMPIHCPEHHYLTAACLLAAYRKLQGESLQRLEEDLAEAAQRCRNILGGFCGFYGACGAAVGCGVFLSIFADTSPLTKGSAWGLVNGITAACLGSIAGAGGPRCCKRCCTLAIEAAVAYMQEHFELTPENIPSPVCQYYPQNKECIGQNCPYWPEGEAFQ